jgi:hypothetical protein
MHSRRPLFWVSQEVSKTRFRVMHYRSVLQFCGCDYRRGEDWVLDILTTYTHPSELHVITVISTLYSSLQHPLSIFQPAVSSNWRSLATISNSRDSSASRAQVLLSHPPVQNSCQFPQSQLTTINSETLNQVLCCNCQLSRYHLFSVIPSAGLGSSLYSLGVDPTENTVFDWSTIVIGVFTDPLTRNGRFFVSPIA